MLDQNRAIIFMGKSGSGKGTQAKKLIAKMESSGTPFLYIELGKIFRGRAAEDTFNGRLIKGTLESGSLLPYFFPLTEVIYKIMHEYTGNEAIIFDGAARGLEEVKILEQVFRFYSIPATTVVMDISDEEVVKRMKLRGRGDDTEESIVKRLSWYKNQVQPGVEFMEDSDYFQVIHVDAEPSVSEIHSNILSLLGPVIK